MRRCGYNSAADGRANVATYDDWFPDARPPVARKPDGGTYTYNKDGAVVGGITCGYFD